MTMTTTKPIKVVKLSNADTLSVPLVLEIPCDGMGRIVGDFAYTAAPSAGPTIAFSEDNLNWDSTQSAQVDVTAAPGITLYRFDLDIRAWTAVQLTIQNPSSGFVRGSARLLPVEEEN